MQRIETYTVEVVVIYGPSHSWMNIKRVILTSRTCSVAGSVQLDNAIKLPFPCITRTYNHFTFEFL